jgi:hypothetical protein
VNCPVESTIGSHFIFDLLHWPWKVRAMGIGANGVGHRVLGHGNPIAGLALHVRQDYAGLVVGEY